MTNEANLPTEPPTVDAGDEPATTDPTNEANAPAGTDPLTIVDSEPTNEANPPALTTELGPPLSGETNEATDLADRAPRAAERTGGHPEVRPRPGPGTASPGPRAWDTDRRRGPRSPRPDRAPGRHRVRRTRERAPPTNEAKPRDRYAARPLPASPAPIVALLALLFWAGPATAIGSRQPAVADPPVADRRFNGRRQRPRRGEVSPVQCPQPSKSGVERRRSPAPAARPVPRPPRNEGVRRGVSVLGVNMRRRVALPVPPVRPRSGFLSR